MEQKSNNGGDTPGLSGWAIIDSGTRRLVGQVEGGYASVGEVAKIHKAVELEASITRIPMQQGIANLHQPIMIPIDLEDHPVTITVMIHNIRWFHEMEDKGKSYMHMYSMLEKQMTQERAKKAGIEIAQRIPPGVPVPRG